MRKKRIEKKVEKLRRKKIHDVLEMVLEINGTHSRDRELTGNKPTAFFYFSGHIADVAVSLYKNGWDFGCEADFRMEAYTDNMHIKEKDMTDLKEGLKSVMEELRRAGKM